jgi:glutathione S-transferase
MREIVIHGLAVSPLVRSIQMCCEEKGVPHRLEVLPREASSSEVHRRLQPFGRIPIVEHGGLRIYETQAILRYINARFPSPPLQPADPGDVGRMRQIMAIPSAQLCLHEIDRLLGGQAFLAGDRLSLADLLIAPQLALLNRTPEGKRLLRGTGLSRWLERMEARPSMKATVPHFPIWSRESRLPPYHAVLQALPS